MNRDNLTHAVRERLQRLPAPYAAHYGVVPLPPPEDGVAGGAVLARLRAADAALVRIETLAAEVKDPYLISRILPRREAVSSSAIEGTNSTLDELLSGEESEDSQQGEAVVQVRDYALALDDFLPRARQEKLEIFTSGLVQDLHHAVMRGDAEYKDKPGDLRQVVVWIGGRGDIAYSTYNPTPPSDIAACLEDTMKYMRCEGMQAMYQSFIVRMAVAHAHFEAVHPFRDGNGRVGRLLLPLMMAAEGMMPIYLSPYIEAHKAAYYESLKAAQQRLDWHEAVGFMADAIVGTTDELLKTRDALSALGDLWRKRRKFRQGSASLRALDVLPHYPVLTVKRLASLLSITVPAASQAVEQLVENKILNERTGYARNRVFAAPDALSIINRPFGEEPILPGADT
ncbi:Fic/DOC family N-terminal domain-containing protein [Bradyrhizobium sp. 45]|uniref:Fic family protein n=1 Tax=Bradyrhizobium sp. 45 TaxID=1043587 RepID=UPI001FF85B63|nr:Fic/DOC family N-terminal domain-containing protein [Bradyrhizobium sp. 45]MCK1305715.1 Fic family protein [Bradyrhizobium sp. 45]